MNKHCYRIIFNKARGMLMVVADIAKAASAGGNQSKCRGSSFSQRVSAINPLCFSLWLMLGVVMPASAGVVADNTAPGKQQPTIVNSANGTPQVNIQTPSAGGVSRNVYSQFDIDQKGVILNNSHTNTQTQLGGMVTANPWLAKNEAKIILNEVNSRDPSKLNGFIEVAGKKAQVIIANPAGITCDGCGFINANRTTLTTGGVQMSNGLVTGYDVTRGEIVVHGNGMDASNSDHADLIARSVKVNAGIWASEINVTTGTNIVDAAHQNISAKEADNSTRPAFALDVSNIGGMYANKIRLKGTEQGLGVRNTGNIGASAGDVIVNADGSISNSGTITAQQNLSLDTQGSISNEGKLYASGYSALKAADMVDNRGIIAAGNDTTLTARQINSSRTGVLAAGVNSNGILTDHGSLTLQSKDALASNGQNIAASALSVEASQVDLSHSQTSGKSIDIVARQGDITTSNANVAASERFSATTSQSINHDGGKLSAAQLQINARKLSNQKGTIQQLGHTDLQLAMREGIDNREGIIATNSNSLSLDTNQLNNQHGSVLHAGNGQLDIRSTVLDGESGSIVSHGKMLLSGTDVNLNKATTQAGAIAIAADTLTNHSGEMTAFDSGDLSIFLNGTLNNQDGLMATDGKVNIVSNAIDNRAGLIQAGKDLGIDTRGNTLLNSGSGPQSGLVSFGALSLTTGEFDNHNGMVAAKSINATTAHLNNQSGKWLADSQMMLTTAGMDNRAGVL
ncbi:MAG: tRNA nuclease CdiA-2 [Candidatus Erwinia impunctatus]|nr:tRNA nuclease CdiA-2 [Culicoides impunctatus]